MMLSIQYPSWISPEIFPGVPVLHVVRWYGLMYLAAFATAYAVFKRFVRAGGIPGEAVTEDDILSLFCWGIVCLLIGARVFASFVYDTSGVYARKPWLIFWPFAEDGRFTGLAGMSYHGGFIGGFCGVLLWCLRYKKPVLPWMDAMCVAIPAGYAWGRLGNFLNGELFGRVTAVPWGVVFPFAARFSYAVPWVQALAERAGVPAPEGGVGLVNLPRHPSQLYESFFEGIALFTALWLLFRRFRARGGKPFDGFFTCAYAGGYGLVRFFIEYFREPDADIGYRIQAVPGAPVYMNVSLLNLSTGQVLCLVMIALSLAAGAALYARERNRRKRGAEAGGRRLRRR